MPQITIPSQDTKRFSRPSKGEVYGNIWSTKNMDFDSNLGKARLSERLYRLYDDGDSANLEVPVKFIRSNGDATDRWWVLVQGGASAVDDGLLYKTTGTDPLVGWTAHSATYNPTDAVDDMEIFGEYTTGQDRLIVARDTDLAMVAILAISGSWWTSESYLNQAALAATNPHPLHQFINLLLVADGNVLHTIDDSLVVVHSRITLPKQYQIIWIEDDGFRTYLGTRHTKGGEALVFPWDGTSKTYDTPLSVNDSISLAGRVDTEGIMHTINGKGQLMAYNGQDFVEVAAFPIAENDLLRWAPDQARGQRVHPNGISLIDSKINILIDGRDSNGNLIENMHSGIWEYDKEVGLYHKYSLGQYDGTTNNEWGNSRLIAPGALVETREDKGKILAGAELYIDAGTTKLETIMTLSSEANQRGYFITPQIHSTDIRTFWKRLNLAFKKFENTTDKIIVKYRIEKDKNFIGTNGIANSFTITWTDTDTFTVSSTVFDNAEVGDEIEITTGKGAGACAHIASISGTTPNYTINLDEIIPNVSGTAYARIQNWIKLGEVSDNSLQKTLFKITKRSKWIQLKIILIGGQTSPELEELLLEFNSSKR